MIHRDRETKRKSKKGKEKVREGNVKN